MKKTKKNQAFQACWGMVWAQGLGVLIDAAYNNDTRF
jgi:hypothetical protein